MTKRWASQEGLTDLLCELVSFPSVTGSQAEVELAEHIAGRLRELEYLQERPDQVRLLPTGDGRHAVAALVKKSEETRKTVILVSHFDVVDVQDYGEWKQQAFDVRALTELFKRDAESMPAAVQADLAAGEWLFGRGTMDMKCGLTMHMSLIEKACAGEFEGNLLLLTVPDEEVNSAGMRAAVPYLLQMADEYGLDYQLVLNSEPIFTKYAGDDRRYVYTGSIGKVLPGFLCYGKETHVGEPFSGLNANYMASQLTCELELNTAFCEQVEGETTPPPTNLIQKDLKQEYNVQIPHRAVTLFNLFVLDKPIDKISQALLDTTRTVARTIEAGYAARATAFAQLEQSVPGKVEVRVLTFDELAQYAHTHHGKEYVEQVLFAQPNEQEDRWKSIEIVDRLAILCKELAPMIVLFYAPPFYPAVSSRKNPLIQRLVPEIQQYAKQQHDEDLHLIHYFAGISDLSYVGLQYPADSMQSMVANMPLWNRGYSLPLQELEAFDVPVLNLGPVGRDAHKWTERLHVDYAFNKLPDMLEMTLRAIFK